MKKYIRGMRDSVGAPIEPDEELPILYDIFDNPIYENEYYFTIDGEEIIDDKDEIYNYIKKNYDRNEAK